MNHLVGGAPDLLAVLPQAIRIEVVRESVDFLGRRPQLGGKKGPINHPAEQVAAVHDRHYDVLQSAEALLLHHLASLEARIAELLDASNEGGALLAAGAILKDVAAPVSVADPDIDELRSVAIEDLDADLVEVDEARAHVAKGVDVEQLGELKLAIDRRRNDVLVLGEVEVLSERVVGRQHGQPSGGARVVGVSTHGRTPGGAGSGDTRLTNSSRVMPSLRLT